MPDDLRFEAHGYTVVLQDSHALCEAVPNALSQLWREDARTAENNHGSGHTP